MQVVMRRGLYAAVPLLLLCVFCMRRSGGAAASGASAAGQQRQVHCFFLLDRTGSMNTLSHAVRTGFNDFVEQQKKQSGAMRMTLAQFNSEKPFELVFANSDVRNVEPLPRFDPRGTTPLYDAVHSLIEHASKVERSTESEIVVAIFTDGHENASRQHSQSEIFKLIEERRKLGWTFVFLGANQDSFGTGRGIAVAKGSTSNFVADARGMRAAWSDFSKSTRRYRSKVSTGVKPTQAERSNYLAGFDSAEKDFAQRGGAAKAGAGGADVPPPGKGGGGGRRRGLKAMKGRQMHAKRGA